MNGKTDKKQVQNIEHSFENPITTEKKVNWVKILSIITVTIIISLVSFYFGGLSINQGQYYSENTSPTSAPSVIRVDPSIQQQEGAKEGWLTYTDSTAGFSIQYPPDMFTLCDSGAGSSQDGIWFWTKGWNCELPSEGGYITSITLESTESFNIHTFTKKSVSETKITLDGKQALYKNYVFSDEDGQLASIGEVRLVVLETERGSYVFEFPGKNTENLKLFDEMIKTFRLIK